MNDYAKHPDIFTKRHIGPSDDDVALMLNELGFSSMSEFINNVIPDSIAFNSSLKVGDGVGEQEALKRGLKRVGILIPAEGKPTIPLRIYPADGRETPLRRTPLGGPKCFAG